MEHFDVAVIGGGPAGYAAAMRAVDFGKRVLLIEKNRVGGAGIYDGALSSKTFWELSRETLSVNTRLRRFGKPELALDFVHITREVNAATRQRAAQLMAHMELIDQRTPGRFHFETGHGRLLDPHQVEIEQDGQRKTIQADHIVLATGSRPRKLPHIPVDEQVILTSDGISGLNNFPESIVILGAGVIGCEFATIFSNFGRTKVFLIDKEEHILPFEDRDLSRMVETNLESNGVVIHRQSKLKSMGIVNGKVEYVLTYADGHEEVCQVEKALISVGRVPNVENLGLAEAGVQQTPTGHIVNDDTRSTTPNVYAVGDLTADIALVNVGELEGRQAIEKIYGAPRRNLIYENISTIMFLNPETAAVGMNELQAQKQNIPYRAAIFDFSCIPRAVAMRRTQGFFKILVTDDNHHKVLGMRALGEHASSAIQAVALLIATDQGIEELADMIHPHPSIIEGVQEAVRMLLGKSIFKPSVFTEYLRYRRFADGHYVEGERP
jgi:dihydrolipoamide dehydrogenase